MEREVCEELRKRMIVVLFAEVRQREQDARILVIDGRRNKLWWPRNEDGVGGVEVVV